MRKPLEMRGWAVKHTAPDGKSVFFDVWLRTRAEARIWRNSLAQDATPEHRYTVVPVVVRERR